MLRERKGKTKKVLAMLSMLLMLIMSLGGCGNAVENEGSGEGNSVSHDGKRNESVSDAKGRYVEETTDLSAKISGYENGLYRLDNGNLIISDKSTDFLKTGDNGKNWMTDSRRWRTSMIEEEIYIMSIAVGSDNTVALIYQADINNQEEEETSAEDFANFVLNPQLMIIKPDNTQIPVDIKLTEDEAYLYQVYIADSGRIFVSTMGNGNIYEVKEDGSSELFLTAEDGRPELICFGKNLMVMDGYGYGGLLIYDMEKKEYIEDEVLSEFITDNYHDRYRTSGNAYPLYFFFSEDDIIYLAGEKGLYRHVMGGNAMEQIIDGKLCSFGNPSYELQGMLALENNEFLALFNGGRVVHYVFDADIPTVPTEKLQVYSLEDNNTIRQAINMYQTQHPEIYIEFVHGMGEGSSITRDDALKNLNTKIMAGEGPDVLVLDNMPLDSYINKGLLLDLSAFTDGLSGEDALFQNIIESVKINNKVYAVPCEVRLPIIMAEKSYISQISDLEDIADVIETLREENPGKDLLGFCSEKGIMKVFSMTCVPSWTTAEGEIDKDAVTEFLKQSKRIYDAQMDGIDERIVKEYEEINDYYAQNLGIGSYDDTDDVRTGTDYISYLGEVTQMVCGVFESIYAYTSLTSVARVEGFHDAEWSDMKGQCSNVFWAETLLGISAASEHTQQAEEFIGMCLGQENQSNLYYGLPVNKAALEKCLTAKENEVGSDGICGSYTVSNDDGFYVHLVRYWPDEELQSMLVEYMETVDTAYIKDEILENAVYEEGIAYMQGAKSLEEAVSAIEKKVSIYMAE